MKWEIIDRKDWERHLTNRKISSGAMIAFRRACERAEDVMVRFNKYLPYVFDYVTYIYSYDYLCEILLQNNGETTSIEDIIISRIDYYDGKGGPFIIVDTRRDYYADESKV